MSIKINQDSTEMKMEFFDLSQRRGYQVSFIIREQ